MRQRARDAQSREAILFQRRRGSRRSTIKRFPGRDCGPVPPELALRRIDVALMSAARPARVAFRHVRKRHNAIALFQYGDSPSVDRRYCSTFLCDFKIRYPSDFARTFACGRDGAGGSARKWFPDNRGGKKSEPAAMTRRKDARVERFASDPRITLGERRPDDGADINRRPCSHILITRIPFCLPCNEFFISAGSRYCVRPLSRACINASRNYRALCSPRPFKTNSGLARPGDKADGSARAKRADSRPVLLCET